MIADDSELAQLRALCLHWDYYYEISVDHGVWVAQRLSDPDPILTAGSAAELRERLREDHAQRAVAAGESGRAAEGGSL